MEYIIPDRKKYMKGITCKRPGAIADATPRNGIARCFELYTSDTYAKLKNPHTGLYFQSSGYVYDFLLKEITTGRMK